MRGVSPEVDSWGSWAIIRRVCDAGVVCWRPVCIEIHLGGIRFRRAVFSHTWYTTGKPVIQGDFLVLSITGACFSGCLTDRQA